jgi:hypothetical protein
MCLVLASSAETAFCESHTLRWLGEDVLHHGVPKRSGRTFRSGKF